MVVIVPRSPRNIAESLPNEPWWRTSVSPFDTIVDIDASLADAFEVPIEPNSRMSTEQSVVPAVEGTSLASAAGGSNIGPRSRR